MRRALAFALVTLAACNKPTELSIDITTGHETDAFTIDPAVTRVDIRVRSLDGEVDVGATAEPGGTFDLGNVPIDKQVIAEVTGLDAGGNIVMRGRSLNGLPLDGIEGGIPVFVQRTAAWARPPGNIAQTHVGGAAATIGERYLVISGGAKAAADPDDTDPAHTDGYDLFSLGGATAATFPRAPRSIATIGDAILLIDDAGATWADYAASTTHDVERPTGLPSFADVAGGAAVSASDGRVFVVGATRRTAPSTAVLEVASDGKLAAYALAVPRKGAAAAWIEGVGLVVAGGSADGPGVEVLPAAGTAFASRGFPPDPVEGAGATTDGASGLALIGGAQGGMPAPTRLVDPSCVTACAASEASGSTLPAALVGVSTYLLTGTRLIVVGDEAEGDGLTRVFLVDLVGGADEIPLKEPRRGAVPAPTPLGNLALLGGEHPDGTPAKTVEMFWTTN